MSSGEQMSYGDPNRKPGQPLDPPKGRGINVQAMLDDEGVDDPLAYAKADDLYRPTQTRGH